MVDYALMNQHLYEGNAKEVERMTREAIAEGRPVQEVMNEGLIAGMSVVGEDFKHNVLYVPEVLIAARAMKAGMAVLKPLLSEREGGSQPVGVLLMGTVRGDLHDIGKNLVCMMAEGAGFEVHDIGVDQSVDKFMSAAAKCKPTIIGMSALLATTMTYMKTVIDGFEAAGLGHIRMVVGGAPVSQMFADKIGADEVTEGMPLLSERTVQEEHLRGNFRLSCQACVTAGSGDLRCHTMRRGHMRIERRALGLPSGLPAKSNPGVTREGERILIDGAEIDRSAGPIHGIAMDLGTTTIVLRLFHLESGKQVADASLENPQRFGGSDVMARISYDSDHRGLLMRTLAGYLSHAIEDFPVDPKTVYELVVAGNSTMRDLFFGKNVYSIGQSPYQSVTEIEMAAGKRTTTSLTSTGRRCLLPIHPNARVYGAPIVSGHVGADAAACMLAIDIAHEERLVAIMDIGTNTELILGNRHRILAASWLAGPAFEGGAIACGMPALDGAIEDVVLEPDGAFRLGVIGGGAPQGICGSGLVDLMSELLRTGRMNAMGRFEDDACGAHRIAIDPANHIFFLESDVNELAQAKGANVAGLQVICNTYGVDFDDIDVFYLAGGFGRHLRVAASRRIGLVPNLPDARIVQVGNAAIEGACMALLSRSLRQELEELVTRVEHCRLETHAGFFDFFVDGCQFKSVESTSVASNSEAAR